MTPIDVLRGARKLIADPDRWLHQGVAWADRHGRWTPLSAMRRVAGLHIAALTNAERHLATAVAPYWTLPEVGIAAWAHDPERTHAEVLAAIDAVIAARLWISDDGLYLARDIPGVSTWRDVIEIATGKVWLGGRMPPKSFDDPRCGLPEFRACVMGWSNCGRYNATRGPYAYQRWIEAWSLGFGDIDIEHAKANPYNARYVGARREATFRRTVPACHVRRHAWAVERVAAALAADPPWSAVGLGGIYGPEASQ